MRDAFVVLWSILFETLGRYRLVVLSWLIAVYYVQYRTKYSTGPSTEQDLATVLRPAQDQVQNRTLPQYYVQYRTKYSTGSSIEQDLATVLRPVQDQVQHRI